jgi:cytochrome c oxidase subunit 4
MNTTHAEGAAQDPAEHAPHVLPLRTYLLTWGGLLALTVITVGASYVDFGAANLWIALLIATAKASLVALLFMHLRHDERFNAIILMSALIFLGVFVGFTMLDTENRGRAEPIERDRPADVRDPFGGGGP